MRIFDFLFRREGRLALFCEKLARVCFFISLFIIPLIYFPWTSEPLEINKQMILIFCAIICLLAWIGLFAIKSELIYKKTKIYWILLALLISSCISYAFSLWHYSSLVGASGQEYSSLASLISYIILFVVGISVIDKKDYITILKAIIICGAVVLLLENSSIIGLEIFKVNLIGAPNALGVYSCAILSSSLGILYFGKRFINDLYSGVAGLITKISYLISIPLSLIVLYALDYWLLWALIAFSICAFFISSFIGKASIVYSGKLVIFIVLFIVSILFIFISTPGDFRYAPEVAPTFGSSVSIAKQTLSDNSILFGSGQGTYEIDFVRYEPESINNTVLWDVVFNRSSSHLLTTLTTSGLVYILVYLLFVISVIYYGFLLLRQSKHEEYVTALCIFIVWMIFLLAQCFYSSNTTLQTMFWLLGATIVAGAVDKIWVTKIEKISTNSFVFTFISVLLVICSLVAGFLSAARYSSDIAYTKAILDMQTGKSIDETIDELIFAATMNRWNDVYARNLSYAFLYKSAQMLADPSVNPDDVIVQITLASDWAKRAIELSPNSVSNYAMLGDVYREITPFVSGSYDYAVAAYEKAIELAPKNPKYYVALGRTYIAQADALGVVIAGDDKTLSEESRVIRDSVLLNAIEAFNNALSLKNDYPVAQYYLALAYERQGNLSEAIARISSLQKTSPYDANLALQLGFLYLQQGKLDDAKESFEYVIGLSPNYSNARWFLSSVLEQQGDIDGAIEQVEKVFELNPDNGLIKERLDSLKAGLAAEEAVEPLEE
jgi:tetratricopeptide (TPR) repeat protein